MKLFLKNTYAATLKPYFTELVNNQVGKDALKGFLGRTHNSNEIRFNKFLTKMSSMD